MALFTSQDAKNVTAALRQAHPDLFAGVKDERIDGVKGILVHVMGNLFGGATTGYRNVEAWEGRMVACSLYAEATKHTSRPVQIYVNASGGSNFLCDASNFALEMLQAGIDSLGRPTAARVDSDTPSTTQTTATTDPALAPHESAESQPILSAEVRYWDDDNASVVFFENDASLPDAEKLKNLVRLVCYYYAKMMYNLGASEPADNLRAHMDWAAVKMGSATMDATRDAADDEVPRVNVDVLLDGLNLVPKRDAEPRLTYTATLIRTGDDGYAVISDYPEGAEAYYGPVSVVFLAQVIASLSFEWWVAGVAGMSLKKMSDIYAAGASEWDTLQKLVLVPSGVVEEALSSDWVPE
jgi:hypothetical protein